MIKKMFNFLTTKNVKKRNVEIDFWRREIDKYCLWYDGMLTLYGENPPQYQDKVIFLNNKLSAMLTWFEIHQKNKYLKDLMLDSAVFAGMRLLDVGAGPFPSALAFEDAEVYSLDPLLPQYSASGFPLHLYEVRNRFIVAPAEAIPVEDGFFDAVISVNAIDHVDNFECSALEIQRVLKTNGMFRMHVHYHSYTAAEPIVLSDDRFLNAFDKIEGLKKIYESRNKCGSSCSEDEKYVIWSNF